MDSLKERLSSFCLAFAARRVEALEEQIRATQYAANEETKSSAGDKYETGRAMAQLEIEKNTEQLSEAVKVLRAAEEIAAHPNTSGLIHPGSVVITDQGNYYLSISAGPFVIDGQTYFTVSGASPIGKALSGLRVGDHFTFNGKAFEIKSIM